MQLASAGHDGRGDGLYTPGYDSSAMAVPTDVCGGPAPANDTHLSGFGGMVPSDGSAFNTHMSGSSLMSPSDGYYGAPASSLNLSMQVPLAAAPHDTYGSHASSSSAQMAGVTPQYDPMPREASAPDSQGSEVRFRRHVVEIHADAAILYALPSLRNLLTYTDHIIRVEETGRLALVESPSGISLRVPGGT